MSFVREVLFRLRLPSGFPGLCPIIPPKNPGSFSPDLPGPTQTPGKQGEGREELGGTELQRFNLAGFCSGSVLSNSPSKSSISSLEASIACPTAHRAHYVSRIKLLGIDDTTTQYQHN